jgi:hypothetical protein
MVALARHVKSPGTYRPGASKALTASISTFLPDQHSLRPEALSYHPQAGWVMREEKIFFWTHWSSMIYTEISPYLSEQRTAPSVMNSSVMLMSDGCA